MCSGSSPATTFPARIASGWPVARDTAAVIFSSTATLESLSANEWPSSSAPCSSPPPKPVAAVTARKMSCKNRNGGFINSFSVSFGELMMEPNSAWTRRMSDSIGKRTFKSFSVVTPFPTNLEEVVSTKLNFQS